MTCGGCEVRVSYAKYVTPPSLSAEVYEVQVGCRTVHIRSILVQFQIL